MSIKDINGSNFDDKHFQRIKHYKGTISLNQIYRCPISKDIINKSNQMFLSSSIRIWYQIHLMAQPPSPTKRNKSEERDRDLKGIYTNLELIVGDV